MPVLSNPVLTLRLIDQGDSDGNTPVTGTTVKAAALTNAEGDHSRTALRNYILDLNDSASHKDLDETISGAKTFSGSVTTTGSLTASGGIALADSEFIKLGVGADLQIWSDGTNGIVKATNGSLNLQSDTVVNIKSEGGAETYATFTKDGSVSLMHNGLGKLETTATGVTVTGSLAVDGVNLGDNEYIKLGAGDDLQLYHTGAEAYTHNLTGHLYIMNSANDSKIQLITDDGSGSTTVYVDCDGASGSVYLYHYGQQKLRTTATGATVSGIIVATSLTGNVTGDVAGNVTGNLTGDVTGTTSSLSNHDTADLTEGTSLYYTDARVRAAVSGTTNEISYNGTTGAFSLASGVGRAAASETKFTTTGTWANSTNAKLVQVICIGAGGTGATGLGSEGGNGGSGCYAMDWVDVTGETSVTVTVGVSVSGAGNSYASTTDVQGTAGGASSFGAYVIAAGGNGGNNYSNGSTDGGNGLASGNAGTGSLQTVLDLTAQRPSGAAAIVQTTVVANTYGGGGQGGRGLYGGNAQIAWCGYSGVVLVRVVG
jgi:hypothetical protein